MPRKRKAVISSEEWWPSPSTEGDFTSPEPTPIPRGNGLMPTPAPRATPSPTATPTPDFYEDRSGVQQNTPSMTIFPSGPDYAGTRGDDFYSGNFEGENYQSFPAAQTPRLEPSFLFGGPSIETPTSPGRGGGGNLDNEPSLFPQNVASNPFDEWWRSTPVTGSASVDAGVSASDGGSIWSDNNTSLQDFGRDTSLGSDLSADLDSLRFGERPAPELPPPDLPPLADETGVNQPPPPGPVGDEWTRTPDDRRFLPESGEPTVQVPRSSGRGGDISSFGTFGNPLSLGAFFGTSLDAMRYGTDRFVSGGDVTYAGGTEHTPGTPGYGDTMVPTPSTGEVQIDPMTGRPYDLESIPEGVAVSPEVRRGELISGPVTGPMSPQAYESATWGGVRSTGYRDPRGSAIGNSVENVRNANLMLMSSQAFGGTPNDNAYSSDEGATRRFGMIGRMNELGEYEQTGDIDPFYRSNMENYRGLVYGSQNRPRGVPATGRGG